jgi:hypothetical protein
VPLERPNAPPEISASALAQLAADAGRLARLLARGRRDPKLAWPHESYVIAEVREGETIASMARAVGWRFIDLSRREPAAVEVSEYERRPTVEIEQGPAVADSLLAFEDAQPMLADSPSSYFPRLLRAPALHVTAAWLHTDAEEDDILLPLAPLHEEFERLRPQTPERFAAALTSLDREMRTAYDKADVAREDLGG